MKILTVLGARPQFIKAGPVSRALRQAGLTETVVHTGQHFDPLMSEIFFRELEIPQPTHNLGVHGLGHGAMTGRMLEGVEQILRSESPDWLLVYGDTNSTLAGALAAAKLNVPVAHVEAGLRSFNRRMPEETNRIVADHVSTLLLCPTSVAVRNLEAEGIQSGVHHVGDVMYDATLSALAAAKGRSSVLPRLRMEPGAYAVATVHRVENTEGAAAFKAVAEWLRNAAREGPVVMPVHPRTRALIDAEPEIPNLILIDPLGYLDMTLLVSQAKAVFTNSGGLQKEAYFHRVPCVTLRGETEWVETIDAGWNRLWTEPDYRPRTRIQDYGNGTAALKVASLLKSPASE